MSQKIGRALMAVAFAMAIVIVGPRAWNLLAGTSGIHDAAALPDRIVVCDRDWRKGGTERSLADIVARDGVAPVVVDPWFFAPCPPGRPGPCTRSADSWPCATVIYVRVGDDAYLGYSLVGGP